MYGHPGLVASHAAALAPQRRQFWAWYKANAIQTDLFPEELEKFALPVDGGLILPAGMFHNESVKHCFTDFFGGRIAEGQKTLEGGSNTPFQCQIDTSGT